MPDGSVSSSIRELANTSLLSVCLYLYSGVSSLTGCGNLVLRDIACGTAA